jgi:hypothetical protein
MNERQATFLICDDVLVSLNGKLFINGVYTGDIVITSAETQLGQLVVVFFCSTPATKPFISLKLQVQLPGEPNPRLLDAFPWLAGGPVQPDRTQLYLRIPFHIANPVLRPGPIDMKILHEEGETFAGRQWIVTVEQAQAMRSPAQVKTN